MNVDKVLPPIFNNLMILLTFGLCSPILALVLVCTISVTGLQWLFFIGRFFLLRLRNPSKLAKRFQSDECQIVEAATLTKKFSLEKDSVKDLEDERRSEANLERRSTISVVMDEPLLILDAILRKTVRYESVYIWPIVITSCLFVTCLSWDMAGDRVGWSGAIWVPICGVLMPPVLWILCRWDGRYCWQSRPAVRGEEIENPVGVTDLTEI
jgi:hypothetical protein